MASTLSIRDMRVLREGATVIDALSLEIRGACWTGIIGANGSGKTTLLRAVSGRIPIDAGSIRLNGELAADRLWLANRVGLAPELSSLPASLTAAELLALVAAREPADPAPLRDLGTALEIDRLAPLRIGTMSAGMRQRIAIYAAFVRKVDVVLLDEPFNWLDPICGFDAKQALDDLVRATGLCLVTALHDLSTLTCLCGRGVLLADGRPVRLLEESELRAGALDVAGFEKAMIADLRHARSAAAG